MSAGHCCATPHCSCADSSAADRSHEPTRALGATLAFAAITSACNAGCSPFWALHLCAHILRQRSMIAQSAANCCRRLDSCNGRSTPDP